jgi:DNA-3-methyladenine glycosylase
MPRRLLSGSVLAAAEALLGARLVRQDPDGSRRIGRIVEVEAYDGPLDRASHARAGRTARTAVMFGPPGRAYVYLVYGMYDCLNVVCGPDGTASAVLVRAVEPIEGFEAMAAARAAARMRRGLRASAAGDARLASGPGRLCSAFGIDRTFTGTDLCDPAASLYLAPAAPGNRAPDRAWTPRIGVAYAGPPWADLDWRLVDRASAALSVSLTAGARSGADPAPRPDPAD